MGNCGDIHTATRRYGFIEAINGDTAVVRLHRMSACSSCESSGKCHSHAGKDILVEVKCGKDSCRKIGDRVCIEVSSGSALKAVGVSFLVPTALIFVSVALVKCCGGTDLLGACCSLVVLALYFVFVHTVRRKIEETFSVRLVD